MTVVCRVIDGGRFALCAWRMMLWEGEPICVELLTSIRERRLRGRDNEQPQLAVHDRAIAIGPGHVVTYLAEGPRCAVRSAEPISAGVVVARRCGGTRGGVPPKRCAWPLASYGRWGSPEP